MLDRTGVNLNDFPGGNLSGQPGGKFTEFFQLTDYLSVLRLLRGTKYIYFTSDKSQIVELCQFMAEEYGEAAPMYGATVRMRTNTLNYQAKFNDMMITKL